MRICISNLYLLPVRDKNKRVARYRLLATQCSSIRDGKRQAMPNPKPML